MGNAGSAVINGVGGTIAIIAIASYMTKPDDKSFKKYLRNRIRSEVKTSSFMERLALKGAARLTINDTNCIVIDYGCVKHGQLKLSNEEMNFIGVFNTWIEI